MHVRPDAACGDAGVGARQTRPVCSGIVHRHGQRSADARARFTGWRPSRFSHEPWPTQQHTTGQSIRRAACARPRMLRTFRPRRIERKRVQRAPGAPAESGLLLPLVGLVGGRPSVGVLKTTRHVPVRLLHHRVALFPGHVCGLVTLVGETRRRGVGRVPWVIGGWGIDQINVRLRRSGGGIRGVFAGRWHGGSHKTIARTAQDRLAERTEEQGGG
jgi:hypothetical protein